MTLSVCHKIDLRLDVESRLQKLWMFLERFLQYETALLFAELTAKCFSQILHFD